MVYTRKISRGKWEKALELCGNNEDLNIDFFPADTLTSELRTSDNTLSIWRVNSLDDAVLAMMSNEHSSLETIYILHTINLPESDFQIKNTDGNTVVEDLIHNHVDIVNLNYSSIGKVAKFFLQKFQSGNYKKYSPSDIKKILNTAIKNGRLKPEKLNDKVQKKL